jgi:hypothetical protein
MSKPHEALRGLDDERLRILAPDATHQHFKGGLYRHLGDARDADTGNFILGKDGLPRQAYIHCYPYERQIWLRDSSEFFGVVDDDGDGFVAVRFREIES